MILNLKLRNELLLLGKLKICYKAVVMLCNDLIFFPCFIPIVYTECEK